MRRCLRARKTTAWAASKRPVPVEPGDCGSAARARKAPGPAAGCGEDGSALILVPAAVLIVVMLGAIAVDSGAAFFAQRELAQAAQTAAEDATRTIQPGAFYNGGHVILEATMADQVATAAVKAQDMRGLQLDGPASVQVSGAQVCVSLTARVPLVFGKAIPGIKAFFAVTAHSTATAAGFLGPRVPRSALCTPPS